MTEQFTTTQAPQTEIAPRDLGYDHLDWTLNLADGDRVVRGGDWLRGSFADPAPAGQRTIGTDAGEIVLPADTAVKVTPRASEWSSTAGLPDHVGWPQSETHTWGAFAGLAVELGGYNDIEFVDPGPGTRFWFRPGAHLDPQSPTWFWDALIEAATAARDTRWGLPPQIDNEQPQG